MGDGGAGRLRAWSGDAKFGRAFGAAQFRPPYSTARHRRKTRDATGASPRAPTLSHPYPVAPRWATSRLRHFEQPALVGHFATFQEHKLANVFSFARAAQPIVRCSPITCRDREGSRFTAPSLVRWCRWNQSETLRRPQRCRCPPIPIDRPCDRPRTTVLPGWEVPMPMRALQGAGRGELRSHGTCGPNVRSRASNTPRATFPALLSRDDCASNAASALAADRFTRMRLRACCVRHDTGHRLLAVHHRKHMPPGVLSSLASLRASP